MPRPTCSCGSPPWLRVGAPPASYLLNLGAASELGVTDEQVQGVLIAIAPVIGSARVASAGAAIMRALGIATAVVEESELPASA